MFDNDTFSQRYDAPAPGHDAILLKLIEEHDQFWQEGNDLRDNDQIDEAGGFYSGSQCLRDQIRITKPATLAGAIAQLELAAEWDDPDMVKTAVAGLREIAAREAQP
jgi:hypothetical protein